MKARLRIRIAPFLFTPRCGCREVRGLLQLRQLSPPHPLLQRPICPLCFATRPSLALVSPPRLLQTHLRCSLGHSRSSVGSVRSPGGTFFPWLPGPHIPACFPPHRQVSLSLPASPPRSPSWAPGLGFRTSSLTTPPLLMGFKPIIRQRSLSVSLLHRRLTRTIASLAFSLGCLKLTSPHTEFPVSPCITPSPAQGLLQPLCSSGPIPGHLPHLLSFHTPCLIHP